MSKRSNQDRARHVTKSTSRGSIFKLYQILCGLCSYTEGLEAHKYRQTFAEAANRDWHYTREHAWVCSECFAAGKHLDGAA